MIAYINFCSKDRDLALRLIQWIGLLGGVKEHEMVLQSSRQVVADGGHAELFEEAKKHFKAVDHFTPFTEDERGWPQSPNHGWMQALQHVREKLQKPWLWMEPDCVPLKSTWLDEIEAEYVKGNKPFMGAEITTPAHRMSGVGAYPPMVVSFLRHKRLADMAVRNEAFDSYFATEIVPKAHFTKLIQNVHWMAPEVAPTFPSMEPLSLIDPQAVLFHRCKDGTLLDRLTDRYWAEHKRAVEAGEKSGYTEIPKLIVGGTSPREAELLAEIERLKKLSSPVSRDDGPMTHGHKAAAGDGPRPKRGKKMKQRTPEQQAAINARMAKARAGRNKAIA